MGTWNIANKARNQAILKDIEKGMSKVDVAKKYNISRQRVHDIVNNYIKKIKKQIRKEKEKI